MGVLRLSATVPPQASTRVMPVYPRLGYQPGAQGDAELARITQRSNLSEGYRIQLSSNNGGFVRSPASAWVSYQVVLDDGEAMLPELASRTIHVEPGSETPTVRSHTLRVRFGSRAQLPEDLKLGAGDTLTLSIVGL